MNREQEHLAKLLHLAVAYKKQIVSRASSTSNRSRRATKHQYDSDAAACLNFLREFDLLSHLQAEHRDEPRDACRPYDAAHLKWRRRGALGSIDANTGDELLGWDTDQFPTNIYLTTYSMLAILNMVAENRRREFRRKVRRESFEPVDLFYAHIGRMDAFARGLKIAAAIRKDGRLANL